MSQADLLKKTFLKTSREHFQKSSRVNALWTCVPDGAHCLWIRANQPGVQQNPAGRSPGYFDVSLVPLLKSGVAGYPDKVVLRLWTLDGGTGINTQLEQLFTVGSNVGNRSGLICQKSVNRTSVKSKGRGLFDFYRESTRDWFHLTDQQHDLIVEDYLAIEQVITNANLW